MDRRPIYDEAGIIDAQEGVVDVDGPDDVHVSLTPEAAEEISERLTQEAVKARGQRRLNRLDHRPR